MKTDMPFQAGASMVEITPAMGIQLAGDIGRYRPVEEIRDPLYARALVLEADGRRCCLLSLDLLDVNPPYHTRIRQEAARRFGLDPTAIMIHAVQNHAAPGIGHGIISEDYPLPDELWFMRGGDDRYTPVAIEGMLAAIGQACAALRPVRVQAGRGVDGRVAFNRRFIMRDGTTRTHPAVCDPAIRYCEGPIDPEVSVITFTDASDQVVAALLHHTCHPVHGYPLRWVSAGWPGVWSAGIQELCGSTCVPLVINGACGNIHHRNHLDPDQQDDYYAMGRKLTVTTAAILTRLTPLDNPVLQVASRTIPLPFRDLDTPDIQAAERLLAEYPEPLWLDEAQTAIRWDWVYAVSLRDLKAGKARQPYSDYEIQAIRIGDAVVLALGGEPFVEAQLQIKAQSPARYTQVAHLCHNEVSYIPTRQAFTGGGYETNTANWSRWTPDALEMIETASIDLLRELFGAARVAP